MRRKVYQDALNKAIDFNLNRIKRPNPSTRIQVNDFNLKRSKNIAFLTILNSYNFVNIILLEY